jgi:MoaA/NifB/PqqE/SkfB family radical SAM enzyme
MRNGKLLRKYYTKLVVYDAGKGSYVKLNETESKVLEQFYLKEVPWEKNDTQLEIPADEIQKISVDLEKRGIIAQGEFAGEVVDTMPKNPEVSYPLKLFLDVTNGCNSQCIHCFMDSGQLYNGELSQEEIFQLIDQLSKLGIMHLSIGGGEPFIRSDLVEMIRYAREQQMGISITTNGTLLTPSLAEELIRLHVKSITVSIDGVTEATFQSIRRNTSLKEARRAVQMLIDYRNQYKETMDISIRTSVNALNRHEMIDIYKMCVEMGVDTLKINNTNAYGRAISEPAILLEEEEFKTILFELQKHETEDCRIEMPIEKYLADKEHNKTLTSCTATKDFINILADGSVVPCSFVFGKIKFGNVKDESLEVILEKALPFDLDNDICNACKAASYKGKAVATKANYILK